MVGLAWLGLDPSKNTTPPRAPSGAKKHQFWKRRAMSIIWQSVPSSPGRPRDLVITFRACEWVLGNRFQSKSIIHLLVSLNTILIHIRGVKTKSIFTSKIHIQSNYSNWPYSPFVRSYHVQTMAHVKNLLKENPNIFAEVQLHCFDDAATVLKLHLHNL